MGGRSLQLWTLSLYLCFAFIVVRHGSLLGNIKSSKYKLRAGDASVPWIVLSRYRSSHGDNSGSNNNLGYWESFRNSTSLQGKWKGFRDEKGDERRILIGVTVK